MFKASAGMTATNFKKGDLVRVDLSRPSYSHHGLLGIVFACRCGEFVRDQRFLIHLQSGSEHWFFDDVLKKIS